MSKPWVVILFIFWTIALLLIAPLLFSVTKESIFTVGGLPFSYTVIETRPLLDWTGKLAHRIVRISWRGDSSLGLMDRHLDLPYLPQAYTTSAERNEKGTTITLTTPDNVVLKLQ